ncbi:MAG: DNA recombination protein RmuC [Alistipes ihumii]
MLPEGKRIVIDSKAPTRAYTERDAGKACREGSSASVRSCRRVERQVHQALLTGRGPIARFRHHVRSEPVFPAGVCRTPRCGYAYNKKVIVSSPTNLFALLKIVDDLWKRDMQSRNARKIADEGGKLYDKFMGFAETLLDLGKSISASSEKYEKAIKQLKTGQGNLIRRTERLRELGVKATKSLPNQLSDYDEEDERTEIETVIENEDKNGEESASVPNVR